MSIRVLGPVEVDGGQGLRPRDRAVLAALVVRRGRPVFPAEIATGGVGRQPTGVVEQTGADLHRPPA